MRAISLWQPWASAIALGLKSIETRHWPTAYRGPLAIHAAKRWGPDEREQAADFADEFGVPALRQPPLGAIVATCRLVKCLTTDELRRAALTYTERAFGNYAPGRFGWVLADVVALPEPIPFKGSQGFFDVPDSLFGETAEGWE